MMSPFSMMATFTMIMSSLMAISSTNWIFLWLGMELNLLSFIPLMMSTKMNQETEASIKYFLAQAIGSSVMLMTSIALWFNKSSPNLLMPILLAMALIMKLGMAPCHMWYPSVMTSISWMSCLILSTWQKLAPIAILSMILYKSMPPMLILAPMNAILGGIMGMNQSHLRTIMAYSSITHMGWMMSLSAMKYPMMTLLYFSMYSLLIAPMFLLFEKFSISSSSTMSNIILKYKYMQILIPLLLMSLGGLPPLTGFIPKWMTILTIANMNPYILIMLIIGSMMNLYYYLNITFNLLTSPVMKSKTHNIMYSNSTPFMLSIILLSLFPLLMM